MKLRSALVVAVIVVSLPLFAAQRTFVSASGNDGNPCSRDLPCRTFAVAMNSTDIGGEVVTLDSAGFGPLTITKSVAVIAPIGVHAGITAFSGTAVTINAPGSIVILRNLYINGQGAAVGVDIAAAGAVHIEHCVVNGFLANAVNVNPATLTDVANVHISQSEIRQNGEAGVFYDASGTLAINDTLLKNNNNGIAIDAGRLVAKNVAAQGNATNGFLVRGSTAGVFATIEHSVASTNSRGYDIINAIASLDESASSENTSTGIRVQPTTGAQVTINRCVVDHNGGAIAIAASSDVTVIGTSIVNNGSAGISATGTPVVKISGNTITRNAQALSCAPAQTIATDNTSTVEGNVSASSGCTAAALAKF